MIYFIETSKQSWYTETIKKIYPSIVLEGEIDLSNIFSDPLADLMIAMIKDKALQLKEKKKLCDKIQQFIEQKEKYNNICSLAEEIDFQGFVEFISETHIDELRSCILGTQEERQSARKSIINGAISYSQAKTPQARYRVQKLASSIIEIVKSFYKKKANKELLLVAVEIVDEIDEKIQESNIEQTQIIVNEIQRGKQEIIDIISSTKDCRMLPISSLRDLSEDNLSQIEDSFDTYLETLSKRHKLYPFYKYTLDSNLGNGLKLKSIPLSKEAFDKYPPNIKFKGTARFGDGDVVTSRPNLDIFDYANRHQLQIKINVQDAKKYLGDFEDPVQDEARLLEGNEIVILPKPFPKAFPCSISLDKVVVFDYVLLRTKEIMDDGNIT